MELGKINSLLCGPCTYVLCCAGPDYGVAPAACRLEPVFMENKD